MEGTSKSLLNSPQEPLHRESKQKSYMLKDLLLVLRSRWQSRDGIQFSAEALLLRTVPMAAGLAPQRHSLRSA